MIEYNNITLQYHYDKYPLFTNVSFCLVEGHNTVLCDVQSGKTSLCKMLLGEVKPNEGQILLDGTPVWQQKGKRRVFVPPQGVLYLPQKPLLFPNKTVEYNLMYPLAVRGQKDHARVLQLAQQFGLEALLKIPAKKLTDGQKKVLSLARGLTVKRKVVLFDGFFDDNLDDCNFSVENVLPMFQGATTVVLTANPSLAAGHTVLFDGPNCIFSGESEQAKQLVQELNWLAIKIAV